MNDVLQQLIGMGPGIGAAVSGDGNAFASFMEGWQRAQREDEQRKRLQQQDTLALEDRDLRLQDRDRNIQRQTAADAAAAEDQQWQNTQRKIGVANTLSTAGDTADSLTGAESSIDALYGMLPPDLQTQVAPARDAALRGSVAKVSGRQKAELKRWVSDELMKSQFVVAHGDSDPDVTQAMPARIRQLAESLTGKSQFRKSDLLSLTETLEQAKPEKTRTPAAAGSFEHFVQTKYGDQPTADQILAARKEYQQVDDKPTVQVNLPGGISGKAGDAALKFQDDYARDSKPYIQLRDAYQRVKAAKPDAAGDLSLIFAYMKILDPNSVVREQEFANAQNAAGVPDRIRNIYNKTMEGVRLNPEQRRQFLTQAESLFENARTNQRQVRSTYSNRAKQWGIPENMVLDEDPLMAEPPASVPPPSLPPMAPVSSRGTTRQPPSPAGGGRKPAVDGERRKFGTELRQWSEARQKWELVTQ